MSLISEILKQAGFIKIHNPFGLLKEYLPYLDGVSQYWQLSEDIPVSVGDSIEIVFKGTGTIQSAYAKFVEASNYRVGVDAGPNGTGFRVRYATATLDGEGIDFQDPIPSEGLHTLAIYPAEDTTISTLGSRGGGELTSLPLYRLRIIKQGNIVTEIPLNDRASGAIQMPSKGGVHATLVNYTPEVWVEEPEISLPKVYSSYSAIQLSSPLLIMTGDEIIIEADFSLVDTSGTRYIVGDPEFKFGIFSSGQLAGKLDSFGVVSYLNGEYVTPEETDLPRGRHSQLRLTVSRGGTVEFIGARELYSGISNLGLRSLEVYRSGEAIVSLRLDDFLSGSVQKPYKGGISATLLDYDQAHWVTTKDPKETTALLDGISQYWKLSTPLEILNGDEVTVKVLIPEGTGASTTLLSRDARYSALLRIRSDGTLEQNGAGSIRINGVSYASGDLFPFSEEVQEVKFLASLGEGGSILTSFLGATPVNNELTGTSWYIPGALISFTVTTNDIPKYSLDLTRLRSPWAVPTHGEGYAHLVNFTSDVWATS